MANTVIALQIKTITAGQSFAIPAGASGIVIENNGSTDDVTITSPNATYTDTWTLKSGQSFSPTSNPVPFDSITVNAGTSTAQIAFVN